MAFGPEYVHGLEVVLNQSLPWGISRIEGGESWAALRVAGGKADAWLMVSWEAGSAGCCLTDASSALALKKSAKAQTPLVEAMKSRFVKGRILSAKQLNYDRVLDLEIVRPVAAGFSVKYFMVLEMTEPTANLILLNENRVIEELARHASPDVNRFRTLLPGHRYVPPPVFEGPLPAEVEHLDFEALTGLRGVGRPLARLIQSHWEERSAREWLEALRQLYANADPDAEKSLRLQKTAKGGFTRFPFAFKETELLIGNALTAAREGVLRPMLEASCARLLRGLNARLERAVKSKERHIKGLEKQLRDQAQAEVFRMKGELLLARLSDIPPRSDKVVLQSWQDGNPVEIQLDPGLSPSRNAERYFKKYRKARVDPQKVSGEIASLQSVADEIREQKELLESINDPAKLEEAVRDVEDWLDPKTAGEKERRRGKEKRGGKKEAKDNRLPPHLRFETGGYTILVGLSARGNRFVTFKQASGDDLWLHAHEVSGAHVIIKGTKGRGELEEDEERVEVLKAAASLAAAHSRSRNALAVQVDYTERRYVRPVPGGSIALVTYVNPGVLRVSPDYWKEYFEKKDLESQNLNAETKRCEDASGIHEVPGEGDR